MTRRKSEPNPAYSAAARLSNAIRLHGADSLEAKAARIEQVTVSAEEYIRRLVAEAPPLPEENKRRIKAILDGGRA